MHISQIECPWKCVLFCQTQTFFNDTFSLCRSSELSLFSFYSIVRVTVCLSLFSLSLSFSFSLSLSIYSLFVFFSLFLSVGYKSMHGQYIDENLCMIIAIICLNNDLYVISINIYNIYIYSFVDSLCLSLSLSRSLSLSLSLIIIVCLAWHFVVL